MLRFAYIHDNVIRALTLNIGEQQHHIHFVQFGVHIGQCAHAAVVDARQRCTVEDYRSHYAALITNCWLHEHFYQLFFELLKLSGSTGYVGFTSKSFAFDRTNTKV
jgi:hypothetical protein